MKCAKITGTISNTKVGIIMKRVILAVLIALLPVSFAEGAGKFAAFPTIGVCTSDSVRYRSQPDTKADVWGRLRKGDKVIVDGQRVVRGETWYEILPSDAQDSAYVYGKYLKPYYDESTQRSRAGKLILDVLQVYSPYEEYDYYDEYGGPEVRRKYNREGWLVRVEAWKPGCSFGNDADEDKNISIGDYIGKLNKILGEPDKMNGSEWIYNAGDYATFTFRIKDGKITRMIYEDKKN